MPDIVAVTRDDIRLTFACPDSTTVLDAAEEAGFYLPCVCRHGRCGTCRAHVLSGAYELAPHEAPLPPGPGGVLLCRCRPIEDLVVALPCRDDQIGRRHVPERHATLEELTHAPEGWTTLSVHLLREGEFGQEADFHAGQFMELRLPGTDLWQRLAMANAPNEEGVLEFLIAPAPDEPLATWLTVAKRGITLQLRGPLGKFTLDEKSPRPRCFVGAGAGLAPLLAMLRHLAALRDRTRMHCVIEAARTDLPFLERSLATLRGALPQLTVALIPANAGTALQAELEKLPGADIYAAGPQDLLDLVYVTAETLGVPPAQLRCVAVGDARDDAADLLTEA
jgi:ferredoxin-NADP reductase/ferredoxin